eukprot:TRINITY_DN1266_c5_g1_i1.p1 TRINITY_DN1266_c5_g1~~TRINITY_DN1266_c5_g1_i1.p1  ORF type:complete len:437 (-),score=113.39 TRINITY_DN1266_c5_g1_i1:166-1476(-)
MMKLHKKDKNKSTKKTGGPSKKDQKAIDKEKQKKIDEALSMWGGPKIQFLDNPKAHENSKNSKQASSIHKTQSTPEIYNSPEIHEEPIPLRYSAIKFMIDKLYQLNAVESQGIFRESGHHNTVRQIVRSLGKSPIIISNSNLGESHQQGGGGVNEYAGALKQYLREAPDPVVPFSDVHKFLEALNNQEYFLKLFAISQAVSEMRMENQLMLRALIYFLKQVVDNSDKNKMTLTNLAIALGPSVLRTREFDMKTTGHCCDLLTLFITHSEDIFADLQLVEPEDSPPTNNSPRGQMTASQSVSLPPQNNEDKRTNQHPPPPNKKLPALPPHVAVNGTENEDEDDDDDDDDEDGDMCDLSEFLGVSSLLSSGNPSGNRKKSSTFGSSPHGPQSMLSQNSRTVSPRTNLDVSNNPNLIKSTSDSSISPNRQSPMQKTLSS